MRLPSRLLVALLVVMLALVMSLGIASTEVKVHAAMAITLPQMSLPFDSSVTNATYNGGPHWSLTF